MYDTENVQFKFSRLRRHLKVLITYAVQCGILNAISKKSKKHFHCSLFVKRIIAIEGTTLLFGLGHTFHDLFFSIVPRHVGSF